MLYICSEEISNKLNVMVMERTELISKLANFVAKKAEEKCYTSFVEKKDREKGIWGEKFTEFLEMSVGGDCSTELKYFSDDAKAYVGMRFRFSSPCVSIRWEENEVECFVEFEFNNKHYVESGKVYEKDNGFHGKGEKIIEAVEVDWYVSEVHMFGVEYSDKVYREWLNEINTTILNK